MVESCSTIIQNCLKTARVYARFLRDFAEVNLIYDSHTYPDKLLAVALRKADPLRLERAAPTDTNHAFL